MIFLLLLSGSLITACKKDAPTLNVPKTKEETRALLIDGTWNWISTATKGGNINEVKAHNPTTDNVKFGGEDPFGGVLEQNETVGDPPVTNNSKTSYEILSNVTLMTGFGIDYPYTITKLDENNLVYYYDYVDNGTSFRVTCTFNR